MKDKGFLYFDKAVSHLQYLLTSSIVYQALVSVHAQTLVVGTELVARPTAALERPLRVDTSVMAAPVVNQAFVKVDTGAGGGVQHEAFVAEALEGTGQVVA